MRSVLVVGATHPHRMHPPWDMVCRIGSAHPHCQRVSMAASHCTHRFQMLVGRGIWHRVHTTTVRATGSEPKRKGCGCGCGTPKVNEDMVGAF